MSDLGDRKNWTKEQEAFYHAGFMSAENDWRNAMKFSDFGEAMLWVEEAKKDLMARYGKIWPPGRFRSKGKANDHQ